MVQVTMVEVVAVAIQGQAWMTNIHHNCDKKAIGVITANMAKFICTNYVRRNSSVISTDDGTC